MEEQKDNYNDEPVLYCKTCLSLRIRSLGNDDSDYCDECGSTDIELCHINEWEDLYFKKHGYKYLNKN